jgi:hypothetical protein
MWKYNNIDFDFDTNNADTMERYENALEVVRDEEIKLKDDTKKASEFIRKYYAMYLKFYDSVIGEGSGVKILGERANIKICMDSFESFLEFVSEQKEQLSRIAAKMSDKYINRLK